MTPVDELEYRQATIDEIYRLRFAVLRPNLTPERIHFPGDGDAPPATWHFGAFAKAPAAGAAPPTDPCAACLTLFASTWNDAPAIQLRGMAVAAPYRGLGVGAKLLRTASDTLSHSPDLPKLWWCNARVEAVGFYERMGWHVISDTFMIETVGPHKKMAFELPVPYL
jgi:GNAT superfamily N-acetyltransferase